MRLSACIVLQVWALAGISGVGLAGWRLMAQRDTIASELERTRQLLQTERQSVLSERLRASLEADRADKEQARAADAFAQLDVHRAEEQEMQVTSANKAAAVKVPTPV
jgi:hypothetical protein